MNNAIFYFFYNFSHQSAFLDNVIIFFAVYFPYVVIFSAGIYLFIRHEVLPGKFPIQEFKKKWREILSAFFSGSLAWIIAKVLKLLINTPRPFDAFIQVQSLVLETGYAFPSGHATFFMALAVSIFFYHKKAGYFFMFFALLISIARIAAGLHFPADILGGFILGALVAHFVKYFSKN